MINKFKFDNRVKYIKHSIQKGEAQAKLTGIKASRGDYILFGEDDLIFDDSYSDVLLKNLVKNNADICAGRIIYIGNNEKFDDAIERLDKLNKPIINYNTLEGNFGIKTKYCEEVPFVHACYMVRKEKIQQIQFDTNFLGNGYREDTNPQISMLENGCKIIFCPNTLCYHLPRLKKDTGGQWSHGQLYYLFWTMKNNVYFLNKHYNFLKRKYSLKPKSILLGYMMIFSLKRFVINIFSKIKHMHSA